MKPFDKRITKLEQQLGPEITAAAQARIEAFICGLPDHELTALLSFLRKCDVAHKTGEDAELTEEEKAVLPLLKKIAEIKEGAGLCH